MVRSGREAFVNREAADFFDLQVGDEVPVSFWAPSFTFSVNGPDDVVEPVGHSSVRVVGIGVFADEVVIDELYHRRRMVVTPEVAQPFTCTFGELRRGDPRELGEVLAEVVPPTCALAYRYFSLQLEDGDARRRPSDGGAAREVHRGERPPPGVHGGGQHRLHRDPDGHPSRPSTGGAVAPARGHRRAGLCPRGGDLHHGRIAPRRDAAGPP